MWGSLLDGVGGTVKRSLALLCRVDVQDVLGFVQQGRRLGTIEYGLVGDQWFGFSRSRNREQDIRSNRN